MPDILLIFGTNSHRAMALALVLAVALAGLV
jgi:hypothetical protein